MVSLEKYNLISAFLEKKTHEIWKHENEERLKKNEQKLNGYEYGFSIADCFCSNYSDLSIYYVFDFSFLKNITVNIPLATKELNKLFGTGNATDVIDALYQASSSPLEKNEYIDYIQNMACCYIMFEEKDCLQDYVLRIDMFRKLDDSRTQPLFKDFTGGLLHALKHFSIGGNSLSTGNENNETTDVAQISELLPQIALALVKYRDNVPNGSSITLPYKNDKYMKYCFYLEETTNVYYLNSCFITDKAK